jgi:hypothetical protein
VDGNEIDIRLKPAELVVLFDLLTRYTDTDVLAITDQAEQRALWNLQCALERVILPPPSHPTPAEARDALRDPVE